MSLRFTTSRDGARRATILVQFRVEPDSIVYALADDLIGTTPHDPEGGADALTKAAIEQIVRDHYSVSGPPEQWAEHDGEDWARCIAAAKRRVAELWEVPTS